MNKRGLSTVVSTLILVLLIITAIGGIWFSINSLLKTGSEKITFGGLTLDLKIESASIDYDTGIATVKVARNVGNFDEEITSIKFLVEDPRNSDIFEQDVINFVELTQRTFELNLTQSDILVLEDIYKISIAPVYIAGGNSISGAEGKETIGSIADSIGDLNEGLGDLEGEEEIEDPTQTSCVEDADCGTDEWVENTAQCNEDNTAILQYLRTYECNDFNYCNDPEITLELRESCGDGFECYAGSCIDEQIPCTEETVTADCGENEWVGLRSCQTDPEAIIQDYRAYTCVDSFCESSTTSQIVEECDVELEERCSEGECFIPLECLTHEDCEMGEICVDGSCETENVVFSGTINSIWPFNLGEYFDSNDLPKTPNEEETEYIKYTIIFPGSLQESCLKIAEFVYPPTELENTYIKLNESETHIANGDSFEIWETAYGCTLV